MSDRRQSEASEDHARMITPEQFATAARILALDMHEPPDECDHGYVLPRDCPNAVCGDRAVEWAWYVGRQGRVPFPLREADIEVVGK